MRRRYSDKLSSVPCTLEFNGTVWHSATWNEIKTSSWPASVPFTTNRLLVGNYGAAAALMKEGVQSVSGNPIVARSPDILMHPLEMVEGGLSEVEDRVLRELATEAGGSRVYVWTGDKLTDEEVMSKLDERHQSSNAP